MKRWFTSDHHFNHKRIIELAHRPFSTVEEMNEEIIKRHNSIVDPDDVVYFIGDVCMGPIFESLPLIARMNGHKILISGNHDRCSPLYKHHTEEKRDMFRLEYLKYFDAIYDEITIGIGNEASLLTHLQYRGSVHSNSQYDTDFEPMMPENTGLWHLHGHTHSNIQINGKEIHVGVDAWDFYPVPEAHLIKLMEEYNEAVNSGRLSGQEDGTVKVLDIT